MSKLTIADLTTEVELSSAAMSKIGGGMSCEAGQAVAAVYLSVAKILLIAGDNEGSTSASDKGLGVLQGACGK